MVSHKGALRCMGKLDAAGIDVRSGIRVVRGPHQVRSARSERSQDISAGAEVRRRLEDCALHVTPAIKLPSVGLDVDLPTPRRLSAVVVDSFKRRRKWGNPTQHGWTERPRGQRVTNALGR